MSENEASVSFELALAHVADLAGGLSVSNDVSDLKRIDADRTLLELRSKVCDRQGNTICEATIEVLCEQVATLAAGDRRAPREVAGQPAPREVAGQPMSESSGARYWADALPPQEAAAFTPVPM